MRALCQLCAFVFVSVLPLVPFLTVVATFIAPLIQSEENLSFESRVLDSVTGLSRTRAALAEGFAFGSLSASAQNWNDYLFSLRRYETHRE